MSTDRLIDELWGEHPPASAAKTVQVYVSQLRKALGHEVLQTKGRAYLLDVATDQVDADRLEQLARDGLVALQTADAASARRLLGAALELWRGAPLADFAFEPFARGEIERLDEIHLAVLENRIDADLALGEHAALIGELQALTHDHPLRERLQGQLMLALYRSGRQVDALERYQLARTVLMTELGLQPGRALLDIERAILAHDPALDAPRRSLARERVGGPSRMRRGGILIGGGGVLLLAAALGALVANSGGGPSSHISADSVAVIDATSGKLVDDVAVGARPSDISADRHSVWVANVQDGSISQIDQASDRVISTTAPDFNIDGLAADANGLWLSDLHRSSAVRLDTTFRTVAATIPIARSAPFLQTAGPVAIGYGSVWLGNGHASILRLDQATGAVRARIDVGNDPVAIAVGLGAVWVADTDDGTVTRIERATDAVTQTTPIGQDLSAIAVGAGAVWVADTGDDRVVRIDPESGSVAATIGVGRHPTGVAVANGEVWVANSLSGSLTRIDPRSDRADLTVKLGESPQSLAFARGRLWVSIDASSATSAPTPREGGAEILKVLLTDDPGSTDPALVSADFQRAYAACALLLNYPDQPFGAGDRLVPEVAAGQPAVSDRGRTYTYLVRPGFRFSPPSNQAVTASAFKRAIERALSPKLQSFAAGFMGDIVGASGYMAGRTDRLAGVTVDGDRLVIRLVRAAPDLPARLATPWFCAVPPETPISAQGTPLIPSAGPYYVSTAVPNRRIVLRRNPNYRGDRPRRASEIDYEIGISPARAVQQIAAGRADYYANEVLGSGIPQASQAALAARYGPTSAAARAGRQQYYEEPQLSVFSLLFNTHRRPFDNLRLRQAVNYALDRRALAAVAFPGSTAKPTDQYIPPGVPGFRDAAIYPLGAPNLKKAKRLAGNTHTRAVLDTCNLASCAQFASIVTRDLAAIGITIDARRLAIPRLFDAVGEAGKQQFDLAQYPYIVDFPDPSDFINLQFESDQSLNKLFTEPMFDRRMSAAAQLTGERRYTAYGRLEDDLAREAAPAAAYASGTTTAFLSARVGCQVDQPIYGIDLGALCLRR